ncbi:peptide transporter PTR2A [Punctularia strigosozonata HHB-11173 SS5]|uniref:Peptide transporter PTR2A n=1 Tax=Punctularia strigosozonata (strain HHB-11173) TaxID=741275 RepID=R7RZQ4_PUNST|nr:peptide transporter PTR2A [Punctularia strigosozonata HHB-11173 SS5]EIN03463.1 peptide transporter PTR2A [Punctularia strigosozonata HHB-11173 SS5]
MIGLSQIGGPTSAVPTDIDEKRSSSNIDKDIEDLATAAAQDELEYPTDEERQTLRRVSDAIPWNAYLIAIIELAERFSYYGSTVVFTNFIQQPLPLSSRTGAGGLNGQAGALGLGQRTAFALTTFNAFWVYVIPLFGAYIADTYWGRYKTVCVAVGIGMVGHVLLIVSALPPVIAHTQGSLACFVVAIIIMGLGTGGFKANISPLVAEQYQKSKQYIRATTTGERVIVDPMLTTSRIYMYFYLFINIGALVGQIGMTYSEKFIGFWLSFTLPTIVFFLCPIVLYLGRHRYRHSPPTGSILSTVLRLWRFAARGRWSANPIKLYRNMTASDFWESAKPSHQSAESKPRWMTFDDAWVDEVKRGFKACAVFCWYPIYWLAYNQLHGNLTSQAATLETHGLPNDVLANLDPLALIIFIPICDLFIYPGLRRVGFNLTPLKKITLGFYTGCAGMIWAAVVQHYIYKTNPCGTHAATCRDAHNNKLVSPLIVWIQTGSYVLVAFSEIFASITGLEYAFTKAPKNMRSLVMSVFLFTSALSSALGEAFVSLSQDPLLVWNYGVVAVIAGVTGTLFWLAHRKLDAQEDELNNMDEGHVTH